VALRRAVGEHAGDAAAQNALGLFLARAGRKAEALPALRAACRLAPTDLGYRRALRVTVGTMVPAWHWPMMNDAARNAAYRQALERAIQPGMHVLEIGTGSGLLAMMAARAGAGHVTTCEMVPPIAEVAREIVAANGLADRVTVVAKASTEMAVGLDLPRPADLVVSEVLSSEVVGEAARTSLADARARLLAPQAACIPRSATVMGALIGGQALRPHLRVDRVDGFDLTAFNGLRPPALALDLSAYAIQPLSLPTPLVHTPLDGGEMPDGAAAPVVALTATAAGHCLGVAQWLSIDLDGQAQFDNTPFGEAPSQGQAQAQAGAPSGWIHLVYPFDEPVPVTAGQTLRVSVFDTGQAVMVEGPL